MKPQCRALLQALRTRPMTSLDILQSLGIYRASARVHDLRNEGERIATELITVDNRGGESCRVARYSLLTKDDPNGDLWDSESRGVINPPAGRIQ